jgi:hypothetical protein
MNRATWVVVWLASAAAANAEIISGTSITFTGTNPGSGFTSLDNPLALINGSGLSATPTDANVNSVTHANPIVSGGIGNAWATNAPNGGTGDFFATGGTPGTVIFEIELGDTYILDTFYSWSYDFDDTKPAANNIKTITLDYGVGNFTDGTLAGLELTPPVNNLALSVSFGPITADRVQITVTDNWFDGNGTYGGGDRVGSGEFAFHAVPEPTTLLTGIAAGGFLIWRRRFAAKAPA